MPNGDHRTYSEHELAERSWEVAREAHLTAIADLVRSEAIRRGERAEVVLRAVKARIATDETLSALGALRRQQRGG